MQVFRFLDLNPNCVNSDRHQRYFFPQIEYHRSLTENNLGFYFPFQYFFFFVADDLIGKSFRNSPDKTLIPKGLKAIHTKEPTEKEINIKIKVIVKHLNFFPENKESLMLKIPALHVHVG